MTAEDRERLISLLPDFECWQGETIPVWNDEFFRASHVRQAMQEALNAIRSLPVPPVRIQLSRAAGWTMPANTVKVDRSTAWGNPYRVDELVDLEQANKWGWQILQNVRCADAASAVVMFRRSLQSNGASQYAVRSRLAGKNLACWCKPDDPCHADVLLEIANAPAKRRVNLT